MNGKNDSNRRAGGRGHESSRLKQSKENKKKISKKSVTKRSYDTADKSISLDTAHQTNGKKYVSKKRIRRRNKSLLFIILILFIVVLLLTLSITVFFPIKTINVLNNKKYTDKQILSSIGVLTGDNLLLASESRANEAVAKNFPYISSIEFDKKLPFELNVKVNEHSVYAQIKTENSYLRISQDGKILELTDKFQKGSPVIIGVTPDNKAVGESILFKDDFDDETILEKTEKIISAFGKGKLENVTLINFKNMQDIRVTYDNRIVMLLGSSSYLDKKLTHAKKTLETRANNKETGTLNLSRIPGSDNDVSFFSSRELEKDEIAGKR